MQSKSEKKIEKKVANAEYRDANLSTKLLPQSHYFQTLADPFNVHGEKIPDMINSPSSTFTLVNRRVLQLDGSTGFGAVAYGLNGNGSNVTGSLVPVKWTNASVFGGTDYPLGMISVGTGGSPTNLFATGAGGAQTIYHNQWQSASPNNGVPSLYSKTRLVSAGVAAEYLGTTLNAKGTMTVVSVPRGAYRDRANLGAITLAELQNEVDVKVLPINKLRAGTAVYHPIDLKNFDYVDMDLKVDNGTSAVTTEGTEEAECGELFIVVNGAELFATVQLTEVFNYEGIPRQGALNLIQPTQSRSDPIELSMAMNAIEKVPKTASGIQPVQNLQSGNTQLEPLQSSTGGKHQATEPQREADEEETFFEKILDTGVDLASNFAPGALGKLAPLAKGAIKSLL